MDTLYAWVFPDKIFWILCNDEQQMSARIFFVCIILVLIGADIYLHRLNQALQQDIDADAQQCQRRLAMLEDSYKNRPVEKVRAAISQSPDNQPAVTPPEKPEVNLEKLVSHGHRVQAVTNKYEFLLESAQIDAADKKLLRKLLLQREKLTNAIMLAEQNATDSGEMVIQLYDVEDQIQLVLTDPLDYDRYEFLKERHL